MSAVKLNFSLDEQVAVLMRQRAAELKIPTSRYLADLVLQDVRHQQDLLAAEGYQALSGDMGDFAGAALPLARKVWPAWEANVQEEPALTVPVHPDTREIEDEAIRQDALFAEGVSNLYSREIEGEHVGETEAR